MFKASCLVFISLRSTLKTVCILSTQCISALCYSFNTLYVFRPNYLVLAQAVSVRLFTSWALFLFHMGLTVNKVTLGQTFLSALRFSLFHVIPQMLYTHLYPFLYYVCGRSKLYGLPNKSHLYIHLFWWEICRPLYTAILLQLLKI
jgi:hypothetical protein